MNFTRPKQETDYSFDLTALIDVTLLLLTFFVMGSQFAQAQRKAIDLPNQPGERAAADSTRAVVVDMLANGTLRLQDGQPVTREQLASILRAEIGLGPAGTANPVDLTIRAERGAKSGQLSALATEVARAGVRKWKIATLGTSPNLRGTGTP